MPGFAPHSDPAAPSGLTKIVSGGQTGVDRAGLDAALDAGLAVGGWCPRGRLAEDGRVPGRYPLREMAKPGYPPRTRQNVLDSDATLILTAGEPSGGTRLTLVYARQLDRQFLVADPDAAEPEAIARWLAANRIAVLNVAGPKESKAPGIYASSRELLRRAFTLAAKRDTVGETPAGYPETAAAGLKRRRKAPISRSWQRKKRPRKGNPIPSNPS